jgi:hypothetical protein
MTRQPATRRLATQRLMAPNDPNGNPQRLVAVYDLGQAGDMVALYDEGYSGRQIALEDMTQTEREYRIELPSWDIGRSEYHAAKREAKRRGMLR